MDEGKHSPTPWVIDEENCGDGANIVSPIGRVAWTSALRRTRAGERVIEATEAKANAAHIVRCVNAHDELVAALKMLRGQYVLFVGPDDDIANVVLKEVGAALAKAGA